MLLTIGFTCLLSQEPKPKQLLCQLIEISEHKSFKIPYLHCCAEVYWQFSYRITVHIIFMQYLVFCVTQAYTYNVKCPTRNVTTLAFFLLFIYCKSTNFGVLLYLANLVFWLGLIYLALPTCVSDVDRTLHRGGDAKFNSCQITLF